MKKFLRSAAAFALAGCMMTASAFAAPNFTDVPTNYWGRTFIEQAADAGLVSGMGDGTYGVNGKLSSAQFVTMVCNLLCKDEVTTYQNNYKPANWWGSYMAVAYTKGYLKDTTVGDSRTASNAWSTSAVNAEISRYDMAQIMVNVAKAQNWTLPTTADVLAAQAKIADWSKIPTKYRDAVATAYAKEYLSGMDSIGTFAGDQSMTRTHGAVVICKLLNENKSSSVIATPTFTNTTKLVNGKDASEGEVVAALKAEKVSYPNNSLWNMGATYRSVALGNSTGADAFALFMADRVFGNFGLDISSADELKPGDIVFINSMRTHVIVEDVDGDEFTYATCNSVGRISWGNTYEIRDLTSWDTVYTRYEGDGDYSSGGSGELTDGKAVTEKNVKALIDEFRDEEYDRGDSWTRSAKYYNFKNSEVDDDESFAYELSDYIFGDLKVKKTTNFDNIKVGDIIYWDEEREFITVLQISTGGGITYLSVFDGTVYQSSSLDVDDLDKDCFVYTRYPSADDKEDTLTDGKSVTVSNVKSLIDDFRYDRDSGYDEGDSWSSKERYKSAAFSNTTATGDKAFAYYFSDYIFGDLKVEDVTDFDDLRPGDVVHWVSEGEDEYFVVLDLDGDDLEYMSAWSGKIEIRIMDVDYLDEDLDSGYTRYNNNDYSSGSNGTLSNDKKATEANVSDLISKFQREKYAENDAWKDSKTYTSKYFNRGKEAEGNEAFAYYLSDYIFGDLDVEEFDDIDDLRVGDVVYHSVWKEYLVITKVNSDSFDYIDVYQEKVDTGNVELTNSNIEELTKMYTRYPTSSSSSSTGKLSNGKTANATNVKALVDAFRSDTRNGYDTGDSWSKSAKYTNFKSSKVSGSESFAYELSDYIFGNAKVTEYTRMSNIKVGDVVYHDGKDEYMVVTRISGDTIYYIGVKVGVSSDKVYTDDFDVDYLGADAFGYTRY